MRYTFNITIFDTTYRASTTEATVFETTSRLEKCPHFCMGYSGGLHPSVLRYYQAAWCKAHPSTLHESARIQCHQFL